MPRGKAKKKKYPKTGRYRKVTKALTTGHGKSGVGIIIYNLTKSRKKK